MGEPRPRYVAVRADYRKRDGMVIKGWIVADAMAEDCPEWVHGNEDATVELVRHTDTGEWLVAIKKDRQAARIEARKLSIEDWQERGIDLETDEMKAQRMQAQAFKQPAVWGSWS